MTKKVSRPVRLSTFVVCEIANEEVINTEALTGEVIKKSDVHYCAEKEAIDKVAESLESLEYCEFTYLIYKSTKTKDGQEQKVQLISKVFADEETCQVVID